MAQARISMSILDDIAAYKREEIAHKKRIKGHAAIEREARYAPSPRGFAESLRRKIGQGGTALIAEIKRASPSKGVIRADFDVASIACAYEAGGAACLSVLTDAPSFQGSDAYLREARDRTTLPVLRKDFMLDVWQIIESRAIGADCILIIMAMVDDGCARELNAAAHDYGMDALIEVHDRRELDRALGLDGCLVGINNRDLHRFETSLSTTESLIRHIPDDYLAVSESGIFSHDDIARLQKAGVGAFLVGESLMRASDITAATKRLLGENAGRQGHER